ncbi:MAG: DUF433 domain-containing protein [Candidatus Binatia bacterium]
MLSHYVDHRDGGYWIAGTRVSLDSVVYAFLEGLSPESIVDSFETLTLEQVYGAIAYYLGNRAHIDASLKQSETEFDEFCRQAREAHPLLYQKLDEARRWRLGEGGHEGTVSS